MQILIDTDATPFKSFGKVALNTCKCLRTLKHDAYIRPWEETIDTEDTDRKLYGNLVDNYDVHIRISQPDSYKCMHGKLKVGLFYYEFERLNEKYAKQLLDADVLWVPSSFIASKVRMKQPDANFFISPTGIDTTRITPFQHEYDGSVPFDFLTVGTQQHCKGTDILIESFQDEFGPDENVRLIIKTNKNFDFGKNLIDPNRQKQIVWIEQDMSEADLDRLYRNAHCYVSATRGEGFNMPVLEAKGYGMPVIATDWSGHLDFCDEDNTLLVIPQKLTSGVLLTGAQGNYVEPSKTHLMSQMRRAIVEFEDWSKVSYKHATQEIWPVYSWMSTTKYLIRQIRKWQDVLTA